ncbi:hypothetical protein [Paenibacillus sp. MER 78]|uniref:hypothetical protein n=1 Tax=Paenibacillus sp. MER 78 TaxID=2939571 RepID=UPI00203DD1D9|nr:hypothetical protein [Paenibacillus sp. MER 78]MCM3128138.1 hypothetical protein [Paenibacillus sp. MER 78]
MREETGYDICIIKLLNEEEEKYSYIAKIIGRNLHLDTANEANQDIIEVAWGDVNDTGKFDSVTASMLNLYLAEWGGKEEQWMMQKKDG